MLAPRPAPHWARPARPLPPLPPRPTRPLSARHRPAATAAAPPPPPPPPTSPSPPSLPSLPTADPVTTSLAVVDWPAVCAAVRRFASTTAGASVAADLPLAPTPAAAADAAALTAAAAYVEGDLGRRIEFGGMSTRRGARAAERAALGAVLTGRDLAAALSLAAGALKLATDVRAAARAAGPAGGAVVDPLVAAVAGVDADAVRALAKALVPALDPAGGLTDAASDALRAARARVRDAEARARRACGGGEPAERRGRLVVAVAPADAPPRGAVLVATDPGGTRYFEPAAAVPANNALAAARGEADAADAAARGVLSAAVADAAPALAAALEAVVDVDVAVARARYGVWIGGDLARLVPLAAPAARGGRARGGSAAATAPPPPPPPASPFIEAYTPDAPLVELRAALQPSLLIAHLSARDAAARAAAAGRLRGAASSPPAPAPPPPRPVPIDFIVRRGARAVVVTGPNTGGKTATLKTLALAALAARAGLPIPARSERGGPPRLPFFDAVLADVGDAQALGSGLSTFSGHLARVTALRRAATPASLVLLDELGTGTDPDEGAALGAALLRSLAGAATAAQGGATPARRRSDVALVVATTHAASLARLAADDARFENVAAEFDDVNLRPTHRLLFGVPGASHGLTIAARLGLDADVVNAARASLGAAGPSLDAAAAALNAARRDASAARDAAAAAAARADAARRAAAAARAAAAETRAAAALEAADAAARAAAGAREELKKRARRERGRAAVAARADRWTPEEREAGAAATAALAGAAAARAAAPFQPAAGDTVYVPRLKAHATVVGVAGGGAKLKLRAGALTTTVGAGDVERARK